MFSEFRGKFSEFPEKFPELSGKCLNVLQLGKFPKLFRKIPERPGSWVLLESSVNFLGSSLILLRSY